MLEISALASHLFESLRQMDAEAVTMRDGHPAGLSWYGAHTRPDSKKSRTEPEWSKRLAKLLRDRGFLANCEHRYPAPNARKKCDLMISTSESDGGEKFWIEVKGAWKHWWLQRGGERIYHSYLFHPLVAGLDQSKTHTAALDLRKLREITRTVGTHIGLLLVGFDGENPMDPDVQDFVRLAKLDDRAWQMHKDSWPDTRRDGQFVRCWCWLREVPGAA